MKSTKHIQAVLVLAIIALSIFAFQPSQAPAETIMIRASQVISGVNKSFIVIYKGNKETERIELDKWRWDKTDDFDKVLSWVQHYEQEGYELVSHSETIFGTNGLINTFILSKN
ncbi:MAG TPA: hypothetical protein DCE41_21115 [Cytophagales bacterium]|nr:hypothetical protein [Cytophagales bacterium]HAA20783.1 hypothetical protein [Cytophagales bacterium]HAP61761.1 hypothetical protein [Cytophagales bacterium]